LLDRDGGALILGKDLGLRHNASDIR